MIVIYGKSESSKSIQDLLNHLGIVYAIMDDKTFNKEILDNSQNIIVSPHIPPHSQIYKSYGSKCLSELSYIGKIYKKLTLPPIQFIGITGTSGKSTVAWILYQTLTKIYPQHKILIAGDFDLNLSQVILNIIKTPSSQKHICIVEVNSYMLYRLQFFRFDYSIWLNIFKSKLKRHGTMDNYFNTKKNIRKRSRIMITSHTIYKLLGRRRQRRSRIYPLTVKIPNTMFSSRHNMQNISSIVTLIKNMSGHRKTTRQILTIINESKPLPHRFDHIKTIKGIKIIDDSMCKNLHSLQLALESIQEKCVLIIGGYDIGCDYSALSNLLEDNVAYMVIFGENKDHLIKAAIRQNIAHIIANSMKSSVNLAIQYAQENKIKYILYSPGAPVDRNFQSIYDRAQVFSNTINQL